jgi:tubulin polyglutamylase TTLL11
MEANGLKTRRLWHEIKMIIVKTVLGMVPEVMINYEHYFCDVPGPQCFQIMGFDIIVRKDGSPLLLEVNSSPSLTIDHSSEFEGQSVRSIVDEVGVGQ